MTNEKRDVNTIVLTKEAYDRMKNENMRCRMLLDSIMKYIQFKSETGNELQVDGDRIVSTIELCYPDTYTQKVSQLKRKRTIEREKSIGIGEKHKSD